jgi:hypothetical protein
MVYYRVLFQDLLEDREHASEREVAARANHAERIVERAPVRADEPVRERVDEETQIPIQRVNSRFNGSEREVKS